MNDNTARVSTDGFLEVRGIRIVDEHGRTRVQIEARDCWAGISIYDEAGYEAASDDGGRASLAVTSEDGFVDDGHGNLAQPRTPMARDRDGQRCARDHP